MGKLVVVTNPELAAGFRLAGVDVFSARTREEAQEVLRSLLARSEDDVVAVDSEYLVEPPEDIRRRVEEGYHPLVIGIPKPRVVRPEDRRSHYIREMIRRAIGFQIAFGEGREETGS